MAAAPPRTGSLLTHLDKLWTSRNKGVFIRYMFNNFWSNNTVKWFWFLVSEFLHCCTSVLYSVSHHWIMWSMSQCCVNITCRSINSCYFCSKSCKWLLRIKNIKILNIYNFSAQWVENWPQSRRYGLIPRATTILRVLKYEKWRYFLYPANMIALFSLTLIIVMWCGETSKLRSLHFNVCELR